MSIWGNISNRISQWPVARKWVIGGLATLVLVGAVFFSDDIQNLWQWLRGEAAPMNWVTGPDLPEATKHGKTIVIDSYDDKRYLYLIGGLKQEQVSGETHLELLDNVQRIELDKTTGAIKEFDLPGGGTSQATWNQGTTGTEPWLRMYSGHAEFGTIYHEYDYGGVTHRLIYVISGDIHVPNISDADIDNPLLFSTVEKLDLTDANTELLGWQPVALVTGVNFYPEVKRFDNTVHIVGGVYGNIFGEYVNSYVWGDYNVKDPLLAGDDQQKWTEKYKGLRDSGRVIGNPNDLSLPDADGNGDNIRTGTGGEPIIIITDAGISRLAAAPGQVQIQQVGNPVNFADLLSKALLDGSFATTVSEHYTVDLEMGYFGDITIGELGLEQWNGSDHSDPGVSEDSIRSGGNDYEGTLQHFGATSDGTWVVGGVTNISHLRLTVQTGTNNGTYYAVQPVPQGRYGHKLVVFGDAVSGQRLYVLGGASWSTPVVNHSVISGPNPTAIHNETHSFWVIGDDYNPITAVPAPYDYKFIGNESYVWDTVNQLWRGTNSVGAPVGFDSVGNNLLRPLGGAFFGLAELITPIPTDPAHNKTEFLAAGGLANQARTDDYTDTDRQWPGLRRYYDSGSDYIWQKWGISVQVTDRTKYFSYAKGAWESIDEAGGASAIGRTFGASAVGMGGYAVIFGGQSTFQGDPDGLGSETPYDHEDFVPDPDDAVTSQTYRYNRLADEKGEWTTLGNFNISTAFYGLGEVTSGDDTVGKTVYLYKLGGWGSGSDSSGVEFMGPFVYGIPGVVDPRQSTITIEPLRNSYTTISGIDDPVATVWNDHYDYATATLTLKDYYGIIITDPNIVVSLYTSRNVLPPAIDKYRTHEAWDDIRIAEGTPTQGAGWPVAWQGQVVQVDSNGQAKFRLLADRATDSGDLPNLFINVYGYAVKLDSADPTIGQLGVGSAPLIFTRAGHPYRGITDLTANPFEVTADGADQSTLTLDVKDYNSAPLPGFTVKLESVRNVLPTPSNTDVFDTKTLIPDGAGAATAHVSSTKVGFAYITGYYDISGWAALANAPDLISIKGFKTIIVKFSLLGRILSLVPDSGQQGQNLSPLEAVGKNTQWAEDNTKINFISPQSGFAMDGPGDINNLYLVADGLSVTKFVFNTPVSDIDVTLNIVSGGGQFVPANSTSIVVHAGTDKKAYFQYEAGGTAGILKIEATYVGGNTNKLWLPLTKVSPFGMTVTAEPPVIMAASEQSIIEALPMSFGVGIPAGDIDWTTYPAETDDGSVAVIDTGSTGDAWIRLRYTTGTTTSGMTHIFVMGEYQGLQLIGMVTVSRDFSANSAQDIVFNTADSSGQPIDLSITDSEHLASPGGIAIGGSAPVGIWGFVATTTINEPNPIEGGTHDVTYAEIAPFTVSAGNLPTTPYISRIEPTRGWRGDVSRQITITGVNTNFMPNQAGTAHSVVTFTPVVMGMGNQVGITATVISGNLTQLVVSINISENATVGYWNVKVDTGNPAETDPLLHEIAEMAGDQDFLVTTESGYFVDLTAVPNPVNRDGTSKSHLTAAVGFVNDLDGSITYQSGKEVTFDFSPPNSDEGSISPTTDQTAGNDGKAESDYTPDVGAENDSAKVQAAAKINATVTVYGTVTIDKTGVGANDPYPGESTISVTTPIPADGIAYSTVIVTVRNASGNPLLDKNVKLASTLGTIINPPGNELNSDEKGETIFKVSSTVEGLATVTATVDNSFDLQDKIRFDNNVDHTPYFLRVFAPFQNRDYDNQVLFKFRDKNPTHTGDGYTKYSQQFAKNPRTGTDGAGTDANLLLIKGYGGEDIPFYLYTDSTVYTAWVKGKNHLAKDQAGIKASDAVAHVLTISSIATLPIGDVAVASGATKIPGGFHDNVIDTADLFEVVSHWFTTTDLDDFNLDGLVNAFDVVRCLTNFGNGASEP